MTSPQQASVAGRAFAAAGGLLFAASLGYFLLRYASFGVPAGHWTSAGWTAVTIDVLLFTAFALHHSVFARIGAKRLMHTLVPESLERTTYVWVASLLFILTLRLWAPVPGMLWTVTGIWAWGLYVGGAAGVLLTGVAASALDPLELAGVRQAYGHAPAHDRVLSTTGAYGLVRHPIYLGWVLMVWSVPVMTGSRLVFAAISTIYLVVAIPIEEHQMRTDLGASYDAYARQVRWRMLPGLY